MFTCYFFLPIAFNQVITRKAKLFRVLLDLSANIKSALPLISDFKIHIHLNGLPPDDFDYIRYVVSLNRIVSVDITTSTAAVSDKILAVNLGLEKARAGNYDLFFCVDNDLRIPTVTVRLMLETFASNKCEGVVCEKAPLVTHASTEFQQSYSYFIGLALNYQIFPNRRPTGSFYCVDPLRLSAFPLVSNEGDYLTRFKIIHTNTFVYSEYPHCETDEVSRRRRISLASDSLNYVRDIQNFEFVNHIERKFPFPSELQSDLFWRAFFTYKSVIERIDQ